MAVAASRGSWRQLQQEGQHSSSFEAKLILDKSLDLYAAETDAEEVKQFFLNGLNSGGFDLGNLLGEWTAVDYVPVVTDAVEVSEEEASTTTDTTGATQTTGAEVVLPAVVPEVVVTTNNSKGENVVPASSVPSTATVGAESAAADNGAGDINNNVLGIFFAVIGVCLVAFLFVAFVQGRKRQKNRAAETSMGHIGDVHMEEEEDEDEKPKVTVGMWAAGLLPGKGKSNDNNNGAFPTATAASVEVTEIDKVLADLNDSDDSSFVSAIGSDDEDTSVYSGYSGMTGISDLNYQPNNKETDESKLEKVEEMKPAISYLDHSKVSLMRDTSLSTGDAEYEEKGVF